MFYVPAVTRRVRNQLSPVVLLILAFVSATHAQRVPLQSDPTRPVGSDSPHEPLLPESGYLSNTSYTNVYFGFALDLPITATGHMIKLPLMPARQHALLAIAYQNGDLSGSLTIDAIEPAEGLEGFSAKQQQQRINPGPPDRLQPWPQSESQGQPQLGPRGTLTAPRPQVGTPDFQPPGERFRSTVRHKGEKYTALYWTQIKSFRIGIMVSTNDKEFLQKSRQAVAAARFYSTADDGTLASKDGKLVTPQGEPYEGPTVPTWRAEAAIQKGLGLAIPPGEISEGLYRNPALGLQYELPRSWDILPTHNGGNPPADLTALRDFQMLHACSRTLLRVQEHSSGDSAGRNHSSMIILRALDPICLSMRIPVTASEWQITEEVGSSLEALSEFGQVTSHDMVSAANHLFMVFHGTVAVPAEDGQLATRMSQTILATSQNKLLLVWSFLAPTSGQLATMPAGGISVDGSQIELQPALAARR